MHGCFTAAHTWISRLADPSPSVCTCKPAQRSRFSRGCCSVATRRTFRGSEQSQISWIGDHHGEVRGGWWRARRRDMACGMGACGCLRDSLIICDARGVWADLALGHTSQRWVRSSFFAACHPRADYGQLTRILGLPQFMFSVALSTLIFRCGVVGTSRCCCRSIPYLPRACVEGVFCIAMEATSKWRGVLLVSPGSVELIECSG